MNAYLIWNPVNFMCEKPPFKDDGHWQSESAQGLVLLKLLIPLVNIYMKDIMHEKHS